MFSSKIIGFESYTPKNLITNDMLSKIVETSDEWIYTRTGISTRHISTEENTSDFATKVAQKLIEKANISKDDIDILIVATITPDFITPSTACIVQGQIGATNALAFDINVACSGFVYALSVADKFLKSGMYKNALVIGAETLSKLVDWQDRGTCVLFGDGAGGVLLTATEEQNGILAEDLKADGTCFKAITGGKLNVKNPFVQNDTQTEQNDFYLQMNGRDVFNFATKTVPKSIEAVLQKANLTLDDIKYIVPHQANYRIVETVAKKLKTNLDKFYLNLKTYGNTSAASIPIALADMYKNDMLKKGDKIIVTGFGAGLTWASMIMQI